MRAMECAYDAVTYLPSSSEFALSDTQPHDGLDGITRNQRHINGLPDPREPECLNDFLKLKSYSENCSINETKAPKEWLAWAESKVFAPYWQEYPWFEQLRESEPAYREKYGVRYEEQKKAKCEAGRYTLKEAADFIGAKACEREETIVKMLIEAANSETLTTYAPGSRIKYKGSEVRDYYHEVFWDELNAWIKTAMPRLVCEFPNPDTTPAARPEAMTVTAPVLTTQIDEINQDKKLAELFDPVTVAALEKTFPADGKWKSWAERASRNGLKKAAKAGRGQFNPYNAAVWFVSQGGEGLEFSQMLSCTGKQPSCPFT